MNPLITLAALTGPRDSSPATVPGRPARDLSELTRVCPHAYAEGSAHLYGGSTGWIADTLDGVRGLALAEASLVTTTPDGRLTAAIITTETTLEDGKSAVAFAGRFTDAAHRRKDWSKNSCTAACMPCIPLVRPPWPSASKAATQRPWPSITSETFRRLTDGRDGHGD
ncbi:hypothetical protein [Arthrobacter sp. 2MCAF14]|uniref:hypothetical protein n=1 Tax=Arthrobacter sp. 2MCAF14 TaxID=3232982 RepID=UPI003F8E51D2